MTLLGGLLDALERNFNHGARNVRLFEIGKCFHGRPRGGRSRRSGWSCRHGRAQRRRLGFVEWRRRHRFYDLKGAVESVAEAMGLPALEFEPDVDCDFLHPGRKAEVLLGDEVIGVMGQLHPHSGQVQIQTTGLRR